MRLVPLWGDRLLVQGDEGSLVFFFRFWNPPALCKHQDTGLGPKPLPQQRTAKATRWLTYTAVPELSKCKEVWLSMISTPFSCNTPSCVCNVFVSASKPLVQQDPAVRKTKETQPRTATPWHLPLKKHRALKDFFFSYFLFPCFPQSLLFPATTAFIYLPLPKPLDRRGLRQGAV